MLFTSIGIWCFSDHSIEDANLRVMDHRFNIIGKNHHDDHDFHDDHDHHDDLENHNCYDDVDLAEEDSDKKGSSCRISRWWEEERKP